MRLFYLLLMLILLLFSRRVVAEPNYNWNLDIETFEMLPLAEGKAFLINFYDAGLDTPRYVNYSVTGSEKIRLLDGQQTDCWKLQTEGTSEGADLIVKVMLICKKGRKPPESHAGRIFFVKMSLFV